jgi:membrane protein
MATANASGAGARTPAEVPAPGWWAVAKRAWKESTRDNINLIAAGVAFYSFLAFVPLLAAAVLTYGLVAEPSSVVQHMQQLSSAMPQDVAGIIGQQLMSIVESADSKHGFGLILAILLSLYGAMRGATSVITALNIAYDVEEDRGFIKTTLLALMITAGAVVALLLGVIAISALGFLESLLPFSSPIVHTLLKVLTWLLAGAGVSLLIAAIYRYAPNRPNVPWRWLTPGSIFATVLWIAATLGFGFYVANFGSYNATYGSLGAVIVFLTWLYLTAYILLLGGELNSELEKQVEGRATQS